MLIGEGAAQIIGAYFDVKGRVSWLKHIQASFAVEACHLYCLLCNPPPAPGGFSLISFHPYRLSLFLPCSRGKGEVGEVEALVINEVRVFTLPMSAHDVNPQNSRWTSRQIWPYQALFY